LNKVIKQRDGSFYQGATLDQGNEPNEKRSLLRLKLDDGSTNGRYIQLRIIITNVSMTMAVGEILAADITFQAHGAPVLVDI
jgi:hypothetical protein